MIEKLDFEVSETPISQHLSWIIHDLEVVKKKISEKYGENNYLYRRANLASFNLTRCKAGCLNKEKHDG